MSTLDVRELCVGYGATDVVRGVTFSAQPGEVFAVVGASGCGKTTLLRAIAGFITPRSGTVAIGDRLVSGPGVWIPPEKRNVGIVTQEGSLFPHLSVANNIGFGLARKSTVTGESRDSRIAELLALIGMPGAGEFSPHQLSGGQQQRVALARALAPNPEVMLLDEPFTALDSRLRAELRVEVMAILRALRTTTLLITHDQEEALSVADRVAFMADGHFQQIDSPERIYVTPQSPETARFLGGVVELPASAVSAGVAHTCVGPIPVTTDQAGPGTVLIRPEQLMPTAKPGSIRGVVQGIAYHGHDSLIEVRVNPELVVHSRVAGAPVTHVGAPINLTLLGPGLFFPIGRQRT